MLSRPVVASCVALGLALGACYEPLAHTPPTRPISAADSAIPDKEQTHNWVSPQPSRCPEATLPAPGEVPDAELAKQNEIIRTMRPAFRACFKQFIDRHPFFSQGGIRITADIDCTGRVTGMRGVTKNLDRAMAACTMRAVLKTHFDAPSHGIAQLFVPATFSQ